MCQRRLHGATHDRTRCPRRQESGFRRVSLLVTKPGSPGVARTFPRSKLRIIAPLDTRLQHGVESDTGPARFAVAMGHARDQLREFQNLCALQVQLSDVRGPSSSGAFCLEGAISSAFPCIKFKTEHRQAIYRWTQYLDVAIRLARLYPVVAHPNRTFQLRNSFLRFRNFSGVGSRRPRFTSVQAMRTLGGQSSAESAQDCS